MLIQRQHYTCVPDPAGLGRRLAVGGRWMRVRMLHVAVRMRDGRGAAAHLVSRPLRRLGGLRALHRRQLLADQHHPRGAHHAGELHQCVRAAAAGAGGGQSGWSPVSR